MYAWCEGVREGLRTYRTSHCFVAVCVPTLHTPSTLYMCSTSSPGFIELNKQLWMNSEPPRPHVLPLRRTHPDVKKYVDWKRVSYLRTLQHEKISRCGWGVRGVAGVDGVWGEPQVWTRCGGRGHRQEGGGGLLYQGDYPSCRCGQAGRLWGDREGVCRVT